MCVCIYRQAWCCISTVRRPCAGVCSFGVVLVYVARSKYWTSWPDQALRGHMHRKVRWGKPRLAILNIILRPGSALSWTLLYSRKSRCGPIFLRLLSLSSYFGYLGSWLAIIGLTIPFSQLERDITLIYRRLFIVDWQWTTGY